MMFVGREIQQHIVGKSWAEVLYSASDWETGVIDWIFSFFFFQSTDFDSRNKTGKERIILV